MQRFALKALAASVLAASSVAVANAAEYTLRYAHFWPSNSSAHTDVFEAWAKSVEEASNGRIAIELYPAQTLAKADGSYQAMVNGVADIVSVVQGYTAGRFPLSQIAELPDIGASATQTGCVLQTIYDQGLLDGEYQDSHPLYFFATAPGVFHMANKEVRVPSDLNGVRMRNPSPIAGEVLRAAGARNVSMPAPESYESLQRGVIEGTVMPFEGALVFRLNELTNYHLEVPIYSTAFITSMNSRSYDRLPDDLKKVIDDHSGLEWQKKAGIVFDELDRKGRQDAEDAGHEIVTVDNAMEDPDWGPLLQGVTDQYLDDLEKRGVPAREVYEAALAARADCPVDAS